MMSYKLAVIGATGIVGQEILKILTDRRFPVSEVVALASLKSVVQEIEFGFNTLNVKTIETMIFPEWTLR